MILWDTPFTDITPLLNNTGLGAGDSVDIDDKRFCGNSTITTLTAQGVDVSYENNC